MPDEVNKWIQNFFNDESLFMIRALPNNDRIPKGDVSLPGDKISAFTTVAQLHLVNKSSVEELKKVSKANFDHTLWRANVVIETPISYEEDSFDQMRIGNIMLRQQGPCVRCRAMALDWENKKRHEELEPYSTLTRTRMLRGKGPIFGMYYHWDILPDNHESGIKGDSTIKLSDVLHVR